MILQSNKDWSSGSDLYPPLRDLLYMPVANYNALNTGLPVPR